MLRHGRGWKITRDGTAEFVLHPLSGDGEPVILLEFSGATGEGSPAPPSGNRLANPAARPTENPRSRRRDIHRSAARGDSDQAPVGVNSHCASRAGTSRSMR
jgi:hypothetical protein